jgi:hypothetical protein
MLPQPCTAHRPDVNTIGSGGKQTDQARESVDPQLQRTEASILINLPPEYQHRTI